MAHHHALGFPDDGWAVILLSRTEAEPLRATVMETMEPLAALGLDVDVIIRQSVPRRGSVSTS